MQCFKVFLANELFHIFDIKVADPVIEVSDPKNHANVGSTEMTRHANMNISSISKHSTFEKRRICMILYSCFMIVYGGLEGSDWRNVIRVQISLKS